MKLRVLLCAVVAVMLAPASALACGGFFCNAATQSPIYQAGERVVFAKEKGGVAMHIEIVFQGDPTSFGWILPLAEVPTDSAGKPLPLDKGVTISSTVLFDRLQGPTDPIFDVNNTFAGDECVEDFGGAASADAASGGNAGGGGGSEAPPVTVLQEAAIGPYTAQLLKATDADALFAWLNESGYVQDENARPILKYYVEAGYVFVGLRLQSGKSTGDLRPVAIHQSEQAPCVPLRLTSVAATPNMPILVWVLGPGRAIPKNFIHAVVNPAAIAYPGGSNYFEVVNEAIDTLTGHAWITEMAGPAAGFKGTFYSGTGSTEAGLHEAKTVAAVVAALKSLGVRDNVETTDILRAQLGLPEGLKGYPNGSCRYASPPAAECSEECLYPYSNDDCTYYGECGEPTPTEGPGCDDPEHVTTEEELFVYLDWWVQQGAEPATDLPKLIARLEEEVVTPLKDIEAMFAGAETVTRFYTTQDPDEMTRDPIFAFNKELPDVSRTHTLKTVTRYQSCATTDVTATYESGQVHVFPCDNEWSCSATVGPVPGAPALFEAQVIDETGAPQPFDPARAGEVHAALAFAEPGKPSLPADFELPPAEPHDFATSVGGSGGGCSITGSVVSSLGTLALLLLALGLVPRRRLP